MVIYMRAETSGTKERQLFKPLGDIPTGFTWSPKYVSRFKYVPFLAFPESKYPVEVCRHAFYRSRAKLVEEVSAHGSKWDSFLARINSF